MNGIHEREESVKDVVLKQLIPYWIKGLKGDILKFLEYLNIKKDLKFSEQVLTSYFSSLLKMVEIDDITNFHKLVFDFKEKYLDEYNLLTNCPLTEENLFLWYILCNFCKSFNVTFKRAEEHDGMSFVGWIQLGLVFYLYFVLENAEPDAPVTYQTIDLLDEIFPDIPNYCKFIDGYALAKSKLIMPIFKFFFSFRYVTKILENTSVKDENKFVFSQLLSLGKLFKIKDEAQWDFILNTFKKIILVDEYFHIFDNYIEDIVAIFSNYFENDDVKFLDLIFDLINTINNPISVDAEKRAAEYQEKLERLDWCINDKYESKSKAILDGNIDESNRLKTEIDELIVEKQKLVNEQMATETSSNQLMEQQRMETVLLDILGWSIQILTFYFSFDRTKMFFNGACTSAMVFFLWENSKLVSLNCLL